MHNEEHNTTQFPLSGHYSISLQPPVAHANQPKKLNASLIHTQKFHSSTPSIFPSGCFHIYPPAYFPTLFKFSKLSRKMLVQTALRGWRFQSGAVQDSGLHSQWLNPWETRVLRSFGTSSNTNQVKQLHIPQELNHQQETYEAPAKTKGKAKPRHTHHTRECLLRPHYGFGCRGDRQTTDEYGAMRWKVTIHSSMDLVSAALRLVSFSVLPYGAVVTAGAVLVVHSYGWRDFRKLPQLGPS